MTSITDHIAKYIGQHGPIRTIRVRSVKVLGLTSVYTYWDTPRGLVIVYEATPWHVQLDQDVPRHEQLQEAYRVCNYLAQKEKRVIFERPLGPLLDNDAEQLYELLRRNTVGMPVLE